MDEQVLHLRSKDGISTTPSEQINKTMVHDNSALFSYEISTNLYHMNDIIFSPISSYLSTRQNMNPHSNLLIC